jgi:hypothetical protein
MGEARPQGELGLYALECMKNGCSYALERMGDQSLIGEVMSFQVGVPTR